jgi:ribose transport system permease protein
MVNSETDSNSVPTGSKKPDLSTRKSRSVPELAALGVVLAIMIGYFSFTSEFFLQTDNLLNILTAIAVTGVLAIPGTMLLIGGQVDLSVGSGAAFAGVVFAVVSASHGIAVGVIVAIVVGAVAGAVNGFLVTVVGINSLITTLGTLAVLRGGTRLLTDGQTATVSDFAWLGTSRPLLGIPLPVILFVVIAIVAHLVMRYTVFGRSLYSIGSNPVAARLVGIRTGSILFITFVLSGLAMGLGGLILTSQLSSASPNAALGLELTVITAIVLGGASLSGGRGSITGTVVGLLIIGVMNNGLVLINVNSFWQDVARGVLLILAVSFDQLRQRINSRQG